MIARDSQFMRTRLKSVALCFDLTVLLLLHRTFCAVRCQTEPAFQGRQDYHVIESPLRFIFILAVSLLILTL